MRRRVFVSLLLGAAIAGGAVGRALAHGDPASDVLYVQDVFVPYPSPSKATVAALKRSIAAAYTKGYRIKVAVIASRADLGALSKFFKSPNAYAKYLGQEISTVFIGPLLIVMKAGFGIYDGGRSTRAEDHVLASLRPGVSTADALTRAAAVAVHELTIAGALRSKDIRSPLVYPHPATGRRGTTVRLKYSIVDDSERATAAVRIFVGRTVKAQFRTPLRPAVYGRPHSVTWRIPRALQPGTLRFCVVATDPTGNRTAAVCAQLRVR